MKILKVKSILFSLLAMMAVAVSLTSCEQTEVITENQVEADIQERSNDCVQDCYDEYLWLNAQDVDARDSQIENCIAQGGGYRSCVSDAVAWLDQAMAGNYDYYLSCRMECLNNGSSFSPHPSVEVR